MSRLVVAGHSLGAHIAGIAGKRVTTGRIQTIFGLDPGGPLFSINSPQDRFDAGDAVYTEGIRTNAGGNFGFDEPLGQSDFYPNWGRSQPGCGIDISQSCAHSRAHELFAESIISEGFVARRCNSYQEILNRSCNGAGNGVMGGDPGRAGQTGVFFLETNGNTPFARG
jgi:pancreatic triacylglycerol lipase